MESTVEKVHKESPENALPENSTEEKTPTPPPQEPPRKSKKEDRSKKDDKNVEQFMKSLNSLPTLDEKLSLVCKKYVQTADDNKKLQFYIKQSDKRYALLLKEKEQLQQEYNKTVLVKSKLENLCRELQKQNKAIKEESLLKIREEEERRKETQTKFQSTLSEITTLLQQNNDKNAKLRDDNISMTEKFKSVVQQYQLREQQVDKMAKQMTLESQLSDAKLQKAALEHQAEKERLLAEMETLKVTLAQSCAKNMELQGTESALKGQLTVYAVKYDEFQNTLVKSNQVFSGFKEQMEKMSKKIQKLEKESLSWKKRWETSQTTLVSMCSEKQASEERAAAAGRHLQQMQSLCRTLQAERTVLLNTLKEHNIERPPLPVPPPAPAHTPAPAPAHTPASNAKVDAMAANCVQLRQSLAHLQSQLNVLTNKKEESPKPEKQKKSKSKKNKSDKTHKVSQEASDSKEAEVSVKDSSEESQLNVNDTKDDQNDEAKEDKINNKTMESLIQAINMANINLSDLDDKENDLTEKTDATDESIKKDTPEILDDNQELILETMKDNSQLLSESSNEKTEDVRLNDNTIELKENTQAICDENIKKDIAKLDTVENVLEKGSDIKEVLLKDDQNKEVLVKNDKDTEVLVKDDQINLVLVQEDKVKEVLANNDKVREVLTNDDKVKEVLVKDVQIKEVASPDERIEIITQTDKLSLTPNEIDNKEPNLEILNTESSIKVLDADKKVDEQLISVKD